jgi:hypothetical protein
MKKILALLILLCVSGCNQNNLTPADPSTATMLQSGARVSWTVPKTYANGNELTPDQIVSYNIYYGHTSGGPYPNVATAGGNETIATIYMLQKGTWYFVVTCVTTNGQESDYSNEASKTIY